MNNCPSASPADVTPPSSPPPSVRAGTGRVHLDVSHGPCRPLLSPPLRPARYRLSPSSSSTLHPACQPLRRARGQPLPPARAATTSPRPYGDTAFGDSEAPARLDGTSGPQDRQTRSRRTGFGLTVAARAGGCGRLRCSSAGYPRGWRGKAAGEGRTRAAEALGSRRAPTPAQPLSSLV